MLPSLERVAGADNVKILPKITGAEDFSFYALQVPGLFVFLGGHLKVRTLKRHQVIIHLISLQMSHHLKQEPQY